jgi:hypothetical protein
MMSDCARGGGTYVVGKDCKFIAAQPSQYVARPSCGSKTLSNHLQNKIPDGVTMKIVYALKVVEIDEEEGMLAVAGMTLRRSPRSNLQATCDGSPTR